MFVVGIIGDSLGLDAVGRESMYHGLALYPVRAIHGGAFWTPFTYMFLHAHEMHLLMNMMGLYLLGPDLERVFGRQVFLGLYLTSGLLGGLSFLVFSYGPIPVVGASGAIMGLLGAIVAVYPRRVYVLVILMIPLRATVLAVLLVTTHVFFMLTNYGGSVAYDVHLFGGLMGYAVASCLVMRHRRQWRDAFPPSERAYACVELESLAHELAPQEEEGWDPEKRTRYQRLREALRYEDIPSVEELRVNRA